MNAAKHTLLMIAGMMIALFLSGCLEIKLQTRVNRDGSLVRTQMLTGDSLEVLTARFPSVIDSSWVVSVTNVKEQEGQGGWERIATRTFRNADELTAIMTGAPALSLHIRASLEKRFVWFFTEYTYRETYLCYSPFTTIPLSQYVSQAELDRVYRHEMNKEQYTSAADSLSVKDAGDRFMEWRARNMFEAYFAELNRGVQELNDPALSAEELGKHKEDLYDQMKEKVASSGNIDSLLLIAQRVLRNPKVRAAAQANREGFASYWEKLDFVDRVSHSLQTSITVPGLIIDTNAPTIEGSTATWKSMDTWAYIGDFDTWVKSRVVNWWAIGVGGVVVLGALVLAFAHVFRKRAGAAVAP